ncbi:hypothetical protein BSNT_10812 [Bacillus subtilis subsp. natto BEST195]|nr:hypothetical protein BSNT_10812 [Bacillus subtilis subsp. natto BEST195]
MRQSKKRYLFVCPWNEEVNFTLHFFLTIPIYSSVS